MRLLVVLVMLLFSGCLNDFDDDVLNNHLRIHDVDISSPQIRTGTVDLIVHVELDNQMAKSGDVKVLVEATSKTTGLLTETAQTEVGVIDRDTSITVQVPITLPKAGGYDFEISVFQNDQLDEVRRVQLNNLGNLPSNVRETGVKVQQLDFRVENVTDRVVIEATIYLTNEGSSASSALRAHVKAREVSTGLIADEAWLDLASLPPEETHPQATSLRVPDGYNYEVEVVIWDGAFIVERGSGNVQLLPTFEVDDDKEIRVVDPDVSQFIRDGDGDAGADGDARAPGAPWLIIALIIGGIAWTKRRNP